MGTVAQVKVFEPEPLAGRAVDKVQAVFLEVQDAFNVFDPKSELSRLNASAAAVPFKCSPSLWDMLKQARRAHAVSGGAFDVTVKPLMELWGFHCKRGDSLPDAVEIKAAAALVGLDKVVFDDAAHTVKFPVKGMAFDFGGIAKGYAVDLAADALKALGVKRALVNLGGNMYCFPEPPPGQDAYVIGVRDPLDKDNIRGVVELRDMAVATSGNYERYVTIQGKQYTHIVDPRAGLPVSDMLAVTVLTPRGVDSDYLSTTVFINGPDFARKLLPLYPRTSFLVIRRNPQTQAPELVKIGAGWDKVPDKQP